MAKFTMSFFVEESALSLSSQFYSTPLKYIILIRIFQIEHNTGLTTPTDWREPVGYLPVYKPDREFELGTTKNKSTKCSARGGYSLIRA